MINSPIRLFILLISTMLVSACSTPLIENSLVVVEKPPEQLASSKEPSQKTTQYHIQASDPKQSSDRSTISNDGDPQKQMSILQLRPQPPNIDKSRQEDVKFIINRLLDHINDLNDYMNQLEQKIQATNQ